jgi:hypothetical protein
VKFTLTMEGRPTLPAALIPLIGAGGLIYADGGTVKDVLHAGLLAAALLYGQRKADLPAGPLS